MKLIKRMVKRLLSMLGLRRSETVNRGESRPSAFVDDDFDWRTYHETCRGELVEVERDHVTRLSAAELSALSMAILIRDKSARTLHPNHRLLYETVLQLKPSRVIEAPGAAAAITCIIFKCSMRRWI